MRRQHEFLDESARRPPLAVPGNPLLHRTFILQRPVADSEPTLTTCFSPCFPRDSPVDVLGWLYANSAGSVLSVQSLDYDGGVERYVFIRYVELTAQHANKEKGLRIALLLGASV